MPQKYSKKPNKPLDPGLRGPVDATYLPGPFDCAPEPKTKVRAVERYINVGSQYRRYRTVLNDEDADVLRILRTEQTHYAVADLANRLSWCALTYVLATGRVLNVAAMLERKTA